jgi:hypothetical protein
MGKSLFGFELSKLFINESRFYTCVIIKGNLNDKLPLFGCSRLAFGFG